MFNEFIYVTLNWNLPFSNVWNVTEPDDTYDAYGF